MQYFEEEKQSFLKLYKTSLSLPVGVLSLFRKETRINLNEYWMVLVKEIAHGPGKHPSGLDFATASWAIEDMQFQMWRIKQDSDTLRGVVVEKTLIDKFINTIPAGSLWRLNKAAADKLDEDYMQSIEDKLGPCISDIAQHIRERPEILKVSNWRDSKDKRILLHFSRGQWVEYQDKDTMFFFSDDKRICKEKLYDKIDTADMQEWIIKSGEFITVFLKTVYRNYKMEEIDKINEIVAKMDVAGTDVFHSFGLEYLTYTKKPYDLDPVRYGDGESDPEVSTLVNITDGESDV